MMVFKMTDKFRLAAVGSFLTLLAALPGCAGTSESITDYFLLNSTSKASDAEILDPFKLGVGPIELAAYLDEAGIANHLDSNKIVYSDSRRWAEPLGANISQVLVSNLTTLLPNQTVYGFPWKVSQTPDYRLRINIIRFGWFPENRVALEARLELENSNDEIVYAGEEQFGLVAAGADYQSNIAAQDQLLDQLSNRLVGILKDNVLPE